MTHDTQKCMSDMISKLDDKSEPAVDLSALVEVFGVDDRDLFKETFHDYLVSSHATLPDLHEAINSGDSARVGAIAHKLKSSSRTIGAHKLGDICFALEMAGKEQNTVMFKDLQTEFNKEFKGVERFIQEYV